MRRFVVFVLPILLYAGLIFLLSSRSSLPAPKFPGFDKLAHFTEYGIFGVLTARALFGYGVVGRRGLFLAIGLTVLYGVTDEVHQAFTPNREPSLLDLLADLLGGAAGAWAWYALRHRGGQRR